MQVGQLLEARQQRQELAAEIREAPSSVMEQAQQISEKQLVQNAAMAAAMGRGVSGGDQALRDQANTQSADLLNQTAGARSQEHLAR